MSDTQQAPSRNVPTQKMQEAAKAAAERHSVKLPDDALTSFEVCKEFLDKYLSIPSPKALSFAQKISQDKNVPLTDEDKANAKALSAWIDANK